MAAGDAGDHCDQHAAEESDEQGMGGRPPEWECTREQVDDALRCIQRKSDRQPGQTEEQHAQQARHRRPRPPTPADGQRECEQTQVGCPQPSIGMEQFEAQVRCYQQPGRNQQMIGSPGDVTRYDAARKKREHAVCHRQVDRQQQAEGADLDTGEFPQRRCAKRVGGVREQPAQTQHQCQGDGARMPVATAVTPHQRAQRGQQCNPPRKRHEQANHEPGRQSHCTGQGCNLSAKHADANRRIAPQRQVGQGHPTWEHRQQETCHEGRQYLVLHDKRMHPAADHRR